MQHRQQCCRCCNRRVSIMPSLAALWDLQAGSAWGLPGGVCRPGGLHTAVAPSLLHLLPLRRAPRRPHLLLEERGCLVRASLLREPAATLCRLWWDHLLRGVSAGRGDGLAQEAFRLSGVRDAAEWQSLQPGQGQPAVCDLQPEQAPLSRAAVQVLEAKLEMG